LKVIAFSVAVHGIAITNYLPGQISFAHYDSGVPAVAEVQAIAVNRLGNLGETVEGEVAVWRGVPYAQQPIGERRLAPPRAEENRRRRNVRRADMGAQRGTKRCDKQLATDRSEPCFVAAVKIRRNSLQGKQSGRGPCRISPDFPLIKLWPALMANFSGPKRRTGATALSGNKSD
jgi:hypothetical protein